MLDKERGSNIFEPMWWDEKLQKTLGLVDKADMKKIWKIAHVEGVCKNSCIVSKDHGQKLCESTGMYHEFNVRLPGYPQCESMQDLSYQQKSKCVWEVINGEMQ